MMSLGIGPTIVAFVSDTLLGGPSQIGVALAIVSGVTIVASAAMLNYCRGGFRAAVITAREWQ
jgi:membrane protein YqaA with SNARE-associated domain